MSDHDEFVLDAPELHLVDCPKCSGKSQDCDLCFGTGDVTESTAWHWIKEEENNNQNN